MPQRIYLDQAATSWPKLPAAVEAAEKFIRDSGATSGRGAYTSAREADQWVQRARHNLARLVGARDASDVAFCSSGTHALNAAIGGLLRTGSRVLTTAIEHNSVLRPLEAWRKKHGIHVTIMPCDECGLVALPSADVDDKFDLVIVSHGSNVTGRLQDLTAWSKWAHDHNALLIVDASQSLAYVPIDMQAAGIDVLVSAGHKGLGALSGTGLVVAGIDARSRIEPIMWGGTGTASEQLDFAPAWPQTIEVGNLNLPGVISMAVAAEHWLSDAKSIDSWRATLHHFIEQLESRIGRDRLNLIGHDEPNAFLPVISLLPNGWDIHEAAGVLDANFAIEVRAGYHCAALVHRFIQTEARHGTLRFSLGHSTSMDHIRAAVIALDEIL